MEQRKSEKTKKGLTKKRLLVDMDGTLAKFHDEVNYVERMFEQDFFRNLLPFYNMVQGIRLFMEEHPDVEVFVVSAKVNGEPPYCEAEKNLWLDQYLPEIDQAHRIFTEMGRSKADYIEGPVTENDYLLDDYNKGLHLFMEAGGSAIKCHNNINQRGLGSYGGAKGGMWLGPMVHTEDKPELIAAELASHMGLSYDLNKVKAVYTEIRGLAEEKSFHNPLNAIRYASGDERYAEIELYTLKGKAFSATSLEVNSLCKDLEYACNLNAIQASAIIHAMMVPPQNRTMEEIASLCAVEETYDMERKLLPFMREPVERRKSLADMITSASGRQNSFPSNVLSNESVR